MPVDPNIALQVQPSVQLQNPLDVQAKALQVKDFMQKGQLQQAQLDAVNQEAAFKKHEQMVTLGKEATWGANIDPKNTPEQNQASWDKMRATYFNLGLPNADQLPVQYDPNYYAGLKRGSLSASEQLDQIKQQQNLQQKQQELNLNHQENQIKLQGMQADKVDKMAQAFKKDMDPDASRTGNFGQISSRYQAGQRLKTLVNSFEGGNLPAAQMEEMGLGLANMLSGSSGAARSQVEAIVPSSARGDVKKTMSWFLDEPLGADQQKFVQAMSHTVDREMDLANSQLNDIRKKRLPAHERFKQAAPDQYNRMLSEYMNPQGDATDDTAAKVQRLQELRAKAGQ